MRKVWVYTSPEEVDCGLLGRHLLTFIAWIDKTDDGKNTIDIRSVTLHLNLPGQTPREIDLTYKLQSLFYTIGHWETEILNNYKEITSKEFKDEPQVGL